jgi:competence protein ComGC
MTEAIKNSTLAIWSLVLGILSILTCGFGIFLGVPAIICGHIALGKIKESGGMLAGRGMAIAGLIMGYLGLVLFIVGLLAAIAIPSFMKVRGGAQTSACQNGQRQVATAVDVWALDKGVLEGAATDPAAISAFLKDGQLPKCPANNIPIAIPATVGDKVVCPDAAVTDQHTLP